MVDLPGIRSDGFAGPSNPTPARRRPLPWRGVGYAGTGPSRAQVSQISWPRCRLLGVAVQGCPTTQISDTGVVVPR
jgi:hypothetical protein